MPLLRVDDVTCGYGDTEVLRDVSVEVREREIVSIIGPNGAGKSTLMKTIFGLLHPWRGAIVLKEQDISRHTPYRIVTLGMCYVPQVANVFTALTVEENLEMGAFVLKDGGDLERRKERIYQLFPVLKERRRQRAGNMSGGERQMVAMGSALMLDPEVLLLDEPFAALDALTRMQMQDLLMEVWSDRKPTVVLVTHDVDEALYLANRIVILGGTQPASIVAEIAVPVARPRDHNDPAFFDLRAQILGHFGLSHQTDHLRNEAPRDAPSIAAD